MLELFDINLIHFGLTVADMIKRMQFFGYEPHIALRDGRLYPFQKTHINRLCNVFFIQPGKLKA
jgi:hypothetical protein